MAGQGRRLGSQWAISNGGIHLPRQQLIWKDFDDAEATFWTAWFFEAAPVIETLSGAGENASDGYGILSESTFLSGNGENASSGRGVLRKTRVLSGSGDSASDGSGQIVGTVPLSGNGENASEGSGALKITKELSGSGDAASDGSGNLSEATLLSGNGENASEGSGALRATRELAGQGPAASAGSGDLTVSGGEVVYDLDVDFVFTAVDLTVTIVVDAPIPIGGQLVALGTGGVYTGMLSNPDPYFKKLNQPKRHIIVELVGVSGDPL